ncbi:hypothetical protein Trco_003682 [Trichoderma cornu-damae]|uniref:Uncharacterized protein n=1 Tax=Trichoderma cornu-damae TaxID=654480 RepID=A0A9P8TW77_9HYPO|nr:hypothetical protein Trco_003682 [Trichoderma cornu-damae]
MDEEQPSSPTSPCPTPGASASTSSQPTYTTAGTIYNPRSSQRLQPPTRRGRVLKWASEKKPVPFPIKIGSSHVAAHPDDPPLEVSSSMSLGSTMAAWAAPKPWQASKACPACPACQYSPLQQNHDRAFYPLTNLDPAAAMFPPPGLDYPQPLEMQPPPPFLRHVDFKKAPPYAPSIFGEPRMSPFYEPIYIDDEDDSVTNALMNMTVKSLHNLASYPNPYQKSAQKALLRGARPKAGAGPGVPPRLGTPFTYLNGADQAGGRGHSIDGPASVSRQALSDPVSCRQDYHEVRPSARFTASEAVQSAGYQTFVESRYSTPSIGSDSISDAYSSSSMGLAVGPGAPKPLTAGPPGQRQYRRSTFESTFRALHTMPETSQETRPSYEVFFRMLNTMPMTPEELAADEEELNATFDSIFSTSHAIPIEDESEGVEDEADGADAQVEGEKPVLISPDTLLYLTVHSDPVPPLRADKAARRSIPPMWPDWPLGGRGREVFCGDEKRHWPSAPMFPESFGYPRRLTDVDLRERSLRLNMQWYAGLFGDMYIFPKPAPYACLPVVRNVYGAVGDGRPTQSRLTATDKGKWPARSMSFQPSKRDITNNLALLDEVLSRAT